MMDTSEQYIKMCDCPEIQETWKLKQGDWTAFPMTGIISIKHIDEDDEYYSPKKAKTIKKYNTWLPRQDQIQEMLKEEGEIPLTYFYNFVIRGKGYWHGFENAPLPKASMEQLWLAFYMHEKHGKIWDGKKWAKKTEDEE